jgi:polysaccharide pyruvyl transferase WcaK-like protein
LKGVICVGVGAGAGDKTNRYTMKLYQKVLSHDYYHSVRDERSREYVESIGFKAINTGCVSMWMLTPEFCCSIPTVKSSQVVFTLTGGNRAPDIEDVTLVDILKKNYNKVFFWVQGDKDLLYFSRFKNTDDVEIIPPSVEAYDRLLTENDIDYVGTRLHGGIYAMRHKKRAIIIAIDERAREINKANNLNCIEKKDISEKLEEKINSSFATEIKMPYDNICRWKEQFE